MGLQSRLQALGPSVGQAAKTTLAGSHLALRSAPGVKTENIMRIALVLLALCPAFASDADFNGRWNIATPSTIGRGWWLEVRGSETATPHAKFVSAYAGDLNVPDELSIHNGELTLGFRYKQHLQLGAEPASIHRDRKSTRLNSSHAN